MNYPRFKIQNVALALERLFQDIKISFYTQMNSNIGGNSKQLLLLREYHHSLTPLTGRRNKKPCPLANEMRNKIISFF